MGRRQREEREKGRRQEVTWRWEGGKGKRGRKEGGRR